MARVFVLMSILAVVRSFSRAMAAASDFKCVVSTDRKLEGVKRMSGLVPYRDAKSGEQTLLFADNLCYRQSFADGRKFVIAGAEGKTGAAIGAAADTRFSLVSGVCVDPTNPNRIYLGDSFSVRLLDLPPGTPPGAGGVVSIIAGGSDGGSRDGVGSNARFWRVGGILCTPDGQTLIVADVSSYRVCSIAVKTGEVKTILGDGKRANKSGIGTKASVNYPDVLVWDRTPGVKPGTAIWIACSGAVVRFDLQTAEARAVNLVDAPDVVVHSIACTPSGAVLITCSQTQSIYAVGTTNGRLTLLAGSGVRYQHGFTDGEGSAARFSYPYGLLVLDAEQCVQVSDNGNGAIRRVTLPPHFFGGAAPKTLAPTASVTTVPPPAAKAVVPSSAPVPAIAKVATPAPAPASAKPPPAIVKTPSGSLSGGTAAAAIVKSPTPTAAAATAKAGVITTESKAGQFQGPGSVCLYRDKQNGEQTLLVADSMAHCFWQLFSDGRKGVLAGCEGLHGFKQGTAKDCRFHAPTAIAVDPRNPNRIFLCDAVSIRLLDRRNGGPPGGGGGVVSLVAGGEELGFADGGDARFALVLGVVCTSDGQTLIVCDQQNARIRSVHIETGVVTTICGDGNNKVRTGVGVNTSLLYPTNLAFDRATAQPDSALYISGRGVLFRFDLRTGELRSVLKGKKPGASDAPFNPFGVACLANGRVVFTCSNTRSLYSYNPADGDTQLLAGNGVVREDSAASDFEPQSLCVVDSSQCAMIADMENKSVYRVTLPSQLFETTAGSAAVTSPVSTPVKVDSKSPAAPAIASAAAKPPAPTGKPAPPPAFKLPVANVKSAPAPTPAPVSVVKSTPAVAAPTATPNPAPLKVAAAPSVAAAAVAVSPSSALPADVRVWTTEHVAVWASKIEIFKPFLGALRELDGSALVHDADESWLTQTFPSVITRNRMRREIITLRTAHKIDAKDAAPLTGGGAGPAPTTPTAATAAAAVDVKSSPAGLNLDDLSVATFTLTSIPKSADRFDEIEKDFKSSVGNNDDYMASRVKAGKKPIAFRLVAADEISNPVLNARFERVRNKLKALNRTADELKVKVAFHGTRESCLEKIAKTGLLRVGHPLNPSKSTDPGWFGSPKHGVYLSRNCDYSLKYSNDLSPLEPTDTVKVLMFKLISGKSLHVPNKTNGMLPTAGYDSHSSANFLEWFIFDEAMCVPTHILTVKAFEDRRTDADDKSFKG